MRPATNEETERIETFTSLLPNLTEAIREGHTRHFADILEEGDPEDDEPMLQIPTPHDAVTDQKPTQNAEAKSRLQPARTWRLESVIAEFDFEKKEVPRDIIWTYLRIEN